MLEDPHGISQPFPLCRAPPPHPSDLSVTEEAVPEANRERSGAVGGPDLCSASPVDIGPHACGVEVCISRILLIQQRMGLTAPTFVSLTRCHC